MHASLLFLFLFLLVSVLFVVSVVVISCVPVVGCSTSITIVVVVVASDVAVTTADVGTSGTFACNVLALLVFAVLQVMIVGEVAVDTSLEKRRR